MGSISARDFFSKEGKSRVVCNKKDLEEFFVIMQKSAFMLRESSSNPRALLYSSLSIFLSISSSSPFSPFSLFPTIHTLHKTLDLHFYIPSTQATKKNGHSVRYSPLIPPFISSTSPSCSSLIIKTHIAF